MNITAIRIGKTFNTGNYTSKKVEIEAIPDNGQSFEAAMAEVNAIVDAQNPDAPGAWVVGKKAVVPAANPTTTAEATTGSTGKTSSPPLAGKGAKSEKSDPTPPTSTPATVKANSGATNPPFAPGQDIAAEPAPPKKRGRPKKSAEVPAADIVLLDALKATTLDELLAKFTDMRLVADRTKGEAVEAWVLMVTQIARFRETFPGFDTDPTADNFRAAFDAEKTAVVEARAVK